jgi:uncharacterized protein (TIGR02145 family)
MGGIPTYDASVLEFDVIPYFDTISFRYVFGSEEYNEYVCATVSDQVAIFISGPGISGGFSGNSANIALVPGTSIPVAINTVNNGSIGNNGNAFNCPDTVYYLGNSAYFVDNTNGMAIQYDGLTVPMTASTTVIPLETYHIRIAIADGGDSAFDSGIFLETGWYQATNFLQANFHASDSIILPGDFITFTDASIGSPTHWEWDFGDGSTDTVQNPTHNYQYAGSYSVTLVVSDGQNWDTLVQNNIVTVTAIPAISTNHGNIWYFGDQAGLTWNTLSGNGDPMYLMDGELVTNEGNATLCDASGNLLFYTDGIRVWNSQHVVMSNSENTSPGGSLVGDPSSTQSALIVPKPQDPNTYYIFTVDANLGSGGLAYSRVDMTANGGLGDIDLNEKNIPLFTPSTEKITGVPHANGIDIWVVAHAWNNNQFRSYLITSSGVNTSSVVTSNVGALYNGTSGNTRGYMKASPGGGMIAVAIEGSDIWELFSFNQSTGILSNPVTLIHPGSEDCYGVEFSMDENYLYGSERWDVHLHQWDISTSNPLAIHNSHQIVATLGSSAGGALQLGPDEKIYLARNSTKYVGRINNPGLAGTSCNYVDQAVLLGPDINTARDSNEGLPNLYFPASLPYSLSADFVASDTVITLGSAIQFIDLSTGSPTSWLWDYGDGASDTLQNPVHTYQNPGIYNISLTVSDSTSSNMMVKQNYITVEDTVQAPTDWAFTNTGINHVIIFPAGTPILVDSVQISTGDFIGVFYDNNGTEECAGYIAYSNGSLGLTAWGDDPLTPNKDGFATGETFILKVWLYSSGNTVDMTATYDTLFPNLDQFIANGMSGIVSLSGEEFPALSGSGVVADVLCPGDCNGSIDLSISGGNSPYSYEWSNGETSQNINGLCAGTYDVTVSDSGAGSGSGTLPWSVASTGGNHTILIQPSTSILIDGNPAPTADCWIGVFYETSTGNLQCGGYVQWTGVVTSISAWAVDTGDDGFATNETFKWKAWLGTTGQEIDLTATYFNQFPNQGLFTINGMSGVETLTGTSTPIAFSSIILNFTINDPAPLSITGIVSNYSGFSVSAIGATDGSIDVTVSGGNPPYAYNWSTGETIANIATLSAGNYSLTVTDNNGCATEESFELTEPFVQSIYLPYYWSIFSTYMDPVQPAMANVLSDIQTNVSLVKDWDGKVYWPQYLIDQIGDLTPGQGYQIKTFAADTLYVYGAVIQPELHPIVLVNGWNILGYIRTTPAPIANMLSPIDSNREIVIDWNGAVYWPQYGVDLIGDMLPGQGYRMKMNAPDTLLYPPNESPATPFACGDQISDFDGNSYNTVLIGSQCWMKESLKSVHYSDGTGIPLVTGNTSWYNMGSNGIAYCYYNNNSVSYSYYGVLYSWAAAMKGASTSSLVPSGVQGICPSGWHIPSDLEWQMLEGAVDSQYGYPHSVWQGSSWRGFDAGHNLKSSSGWNSGGNGADLYGFMAFAGGTRSGVNGTFSNLGESGYWWSSTQGTSYSTAKARGLSYGKSTVRRENFYKDNGFRVRCVKD